KSLRRLHYDLVELDNRRKEKSSELPIEKMKKMNVGFV
ncbi:hypothetical protein Tco_1387768, partial [Tanacetum coccineum]